MKQYAKENNVPIIEDDGLNILLKILSEDKINNILEIGTAIGYSAVHMHLKTNANIITIERNEDMYNEALKNITNLNLKDSIKVINADALQYDLDNIHVFDIIYIDAAKAQNKKFLDKYKKYLSKNGKIIIDNLYFHGLVHKKQEEIETRNMRQLSRKLNDFHAYLNSTTEFSVKIYNEGDGIGVLTYNYD